MEALNFHNWKAITPIVTFVNVTALTLRISPTHSKRLISNFSLLLPHLCIQDLQLLCGDVPFIMEDVLEKWKDGLRGLVILRLIFNCSGRLYKVSFHCLCDILT